MDNLGWGVILMALVLAYMYLDGKRDRSRALVKLMQDFGSDAINLQDRLFQLQRLQGDLANHQGHLGALEDLLQRLLAQGPPVVNVTVPQAQVQLSEGTTEDRVVPMDYAVNFEVSAVVMQKWMQDRVDEGYVFQWASPDHAVESQEGGLWVIMARPIESSVQVGIEVRGDER